MLQTTWLRKEAPRIAAEFLSVLFFVLVVAAANGFQLFYILFPELGALSSDVLLRPNGKWAREPWKLIATPVIAGCVGTAIARGLSYGVVPILISMTLCIGVVFGLRSAVAPAISAGVLPIVLGVTSWLYPLCILGSLLVLTAVLLIWKLTPYGKALAPNPPFRADSQGHERENRKLEILESMPRGKGWFPALFVFVALLGTAAQITTWRFILFPPLIVMAYEMLGHPDTCPWAKQPFTFTLVCTGAAMCGVGVDRWLGVTPIAAAVVMIFTYGLLRLFKLRIPPALAVGLIPFVLPSATWTYTVSVGVGTGALTLWFLAVRSTQRFVASKSKV